LLSIAGQTIRVDRSISNWLDTMDGVASNNPRSTTGIIIPDITKNYKRQITAEGVLGNRRTTH
jgi:hypothetical protein